MLTRDKYGILGQIQANGSIEGGDGANWTGHYVYLTDDPFLYGEAFSKGGGFVRHPDPTCTNSGFGSFYNGPYDGVMSRDQLTGVIGALIRQKEVVSLLKLGLNHSCRLFLFAYNTRENGEDPNTTPWKWPDLTVFDFWATYLRGFGSVSWCLYPLLCIFDIQMLIATILVNYSTNEDQISYSMKLMISKEFVPTPISWLSCKLLNRNNLLTLINKYWSGWRQQPDMVDLLDKKLIELNIGSYI